MVCIAPGVDFVIPSYVMGKKLAINSCPIAVWCSILLYYVVDICNDTIYNARKHRSSLALWLWCTLCDSTTAILLNKKRRNTGSCLCSSVHVQGCNGPTAAISAGPDLSYAQARQSMQTQPTSTENPSGSSFKNSRQLSVQNPLPWKIPWIMVQKIETGGNIFNEE